MAAIIKNIGTKWLYDERDKLVEALGKKKVAQEIIDCFVNKLDETDERNELGNIYVEFIKKDLESKGISFGDDKYERARLKAQKKRKTKVRFKSEVLQLLFGNDLIIYAAKKGDKTVCKRVVESGY